MKQKQKYKQVRIEEIPREWENNGLHRYLNIIKNCLSHLYKNEKLLFEHNLSERCITFRFANCLQQLFNRHFVDCDYNSSTYYNKSMKRWERRGGKPIRDQKTGKLTKRFIDIIVHKRKASFDSDLICFEIKKWNNYNKEGTKKDLNNLKILTTQYGYLFGFHLVLGKTFEKTRITIFRNGIKRKVDIV